MKFIESVYQKAKADRRRVAIPECSNEIMLKSAVSAASAGIAEVVLVEEKDKIEESAKKYGLDLSKVAIVDLKDEKYAAELVERFLKLPGKVLGKKSIEKRIKKPLYMALIMEAVGDVDCTFGGLDTTTYEFILAATSIIGLEEGCNTASALLLLEMEEFEGTQRNLIGMSDGAICIDPDAEQVASIAISCCDTFEALTGNTARCATLSYSTDGSGTSPDAQKMHDAVSIAKEKRPDLKIDGEFQSDAALLARVAAKKVRRESDVAGQANVLIFPSAAACNIGSKLVQILAKCRSYGPLYQGFKMPVLDCSRGDTEQRIYDNIALACVCASGKLAKKD